MKNQSVIIYAGGGGPAEPVLSKQSVLADAVKSNVKDGAPAPVSASETGRARNWTMPPLRLERECKERPNSATIDNRCVEFDRRENQRCAFTMAEILLSLTIIGVVAAITLPSLTGNINERTWNTQRKTLYARFSQAIPLMGSINGYANAETFVASGLSKVLKINNICDSDHLQDCGITSNINTLKGVNFSLSVPFKLSELNSEMVSYSTSLTGVSNFSAVDSEAVAFETQNGESILLHYMPGCVSEMQETAAHYVMPKICANMIFDLNGLKGPNTVGKDIGMLTVLYPVDSSVVSPYPNINDANNSADITDALKICKSQDSEYRLPTRDEMASLFVNKKLLGILDAGGADSSLYWTSSIISTQKAWAQSMISGRRTPYDRTTELSVRCVKR